MKRFLIKRFSIMLFSIMAMSLVSFWIIELPPGDYLSMYIRQLELRGELVSESRIEALRVQFGFGEPFFTRYYRWVSGIVTRGDFGISFAWRQPVSHLLTERLPATIMISLATMIFTFLVAIPVGIYSSTHQYSIGDYIATVFGFIGLATPPFLLALFLMYSLFTYFNFPVGGLFSEEFRHAPWTIARFFNLLQHLTVPVIITGMAGTAANIRQVRATMLDELNKDYVTTARVKGLAERKLIAKYPVRVAFNPIWSTVGWLLPAIISGAAIVDVVLNMPTIGPLLLGSLQSQDMYLAGSIILIMTILTLIGTFISDIILAISDPRIRYE